MKQFSLLVLVLVVVVGIATPTQSAQAAPHRQRIVLLTSLDMSQVSAPFFLFFLTPHMRNYPNRLARHFVEHFEGRGYQIDVRFGADQYVLWQTLHQPDVAGVFWLSHANYQQSPWTGISGGAAIADAGGFDLGPVFQGIHPNLRFLGIIGCRSLPALWDQLSRDKVDMSKSSRLALYGYDDTVDGLDGLDKMMAVSDKVLERNEVRAGYIEECSVRSGYPLELKRKLPLDSSLRFPAARVEHKGRVLGVFPEGMAGDEQKLLVYLEPWEGPLNPLELKMLASLGANPAVTASQVSLGDLSFSEPWTGAAWKVFADHNGTPLGVPTHVYRYVGASEVDAQTTDYTPYSCGPMPQRRELTVAEAESEKRLRATFAH